MRLTNIVLLILHGLVGVALLGAITHQCASVLCRHPAGGDAFVKRYAGVRQETFAVPIIVLYLSVVVLGAMIYPHYRLNVRVEFEDKCDQLILIRALFDGTGHFRARFDQM